MRQKIRVEISWEVMPEVGIIHDAELIQACLEDNMSVDNIKVKEICSVCNQVDGGQTGEYSCKTCGLPTLHDLPTTKEKVNDE